MSVMSGDAVLKEITGNMEMAIKLLSGLLQLLMQMEQHHHDRVVHDKSITHKIGKGALGATALAAGFIAKKLIKSGQVDLKKFNKLQKKTDFEYTKLPTSKLPEIMDKAKKAGFPLISCDMGGNLSMVACPKGNMQTLDMILKMMISKECQKEKAYEINTNADFLGDNSGIFHNILDAYDIPAITFKNEDGTELIAVSAEYQEQYLDACAEAKEKIKDIENIEITDFVNDGFVWDDPNTTAIEIEPLQARYLEEYYKNVKIADVDGKLYAYGKNIEEDVNSVIKEDNAIKKNLAEWQIDVIDNSITLNKEKLLGKDLGEKQLVKLPGEKDTFILIEKSELKEKDNGKTVTSKLDYDRNYTICDASGVAKEERKGSELAAFFSTRSPFIKVMNDATDKSLYNNSIDRVELFNEKTNKLISIPIADRDTIMRSLINRVGMDERTANRMAETISSKMSEEYRNKYGYEDKKKADYTVGKTTLNAVKAAILAQKLKNFKCCNKEDDNVQGDVFAIMDKRSQQYVFVDKNKWYQVDDKLKEMGYMSVERTAVISKLKQTYNINGELESSMHFGQTINVSEPSLENVRFSDLGDGVTTIFNKADDTLYYATIDKSVTSLELEQICREKLGIKKDVAIAEMGKAFEDKTSGFVDMGKDRIDGKNYSFSQVTSKYIQISDGSNSIMVNKNMINAEKLSHDLGVSEKGAEKIVKKINTSFKAKNEVKGVTSLSKLKSEAQKTYMLNKEQSINEKGQIKSEKVQTGERSM